MDALSERLGRLRLRLKAATAPAPSPASLRAADFVTFPPSQRGGATCANCAHESKGVCQFQGQLNGVRVDLRGLAVDADNCCSAWDSPGTEHHGRGAGGKSLPARLTSLRTRLKAMKATGSVYLIRHGKTKFNTDGKEAPDLIRGWIDVPLDAEGKRQAKELGPLGKQLALKRVASSDLQRASATAAAIAEAAGVDVEETKALRPWHLGDWQGKPAVDSLDEMRHLVRESPDEKVPGGESFNTFKTRFLDYLQEVLADLDGDNVALITHYRCCKLTDAWVAAGAGDEGDIDLKVFFSNDLPTGAILRLYKGKGGAWELERVKGQEPGEEGPAEKAYNPDEPRKPAGGEGGGEWAGGGTGAAPAEVATPADTAAHLTDADRAAIRDYTVEGHEQINRALRAGRGKPPADLRARVAAIDAAIARAPRLREPITVYRGLDFEPDALLAFTTALDRATRTGKPWTEHAYTSASLDRETADQLFGVTSTEDATIVRMEITTRHGLYVEDESGNSGEAEFLLARGSKFRVLGKSKEMRHGRIEINYRLEHVEEGAAKSLPARLAALRVRLKAQGHKPAGTPEGGQFTSGEGGGGGGKPADHPGAAHGSAVKVKPSKKRAWQGDPVELETVLTKQETGRVGEAVVLAYLKDVLGFKDARPMNSGKTNFPVDLIEDHAPTEVKAGLASNSRKAQQWRLTFSKETRAEKEWYETATPAQRSAWNAEKQKRIHERKKAVISGLEKETGKKVTPRTITTVINPDTKTADIFVFDGLHDRIDWQSAEAKKAYKGTVSYGHA